MEDQEAPETQEEYEEEPEYETMEDELPQNMSAAALIYITQIPKDTPQEVKTLLFGFVNHLVSLSNFDADDIKHGDQLFEKAVLKLKLSIPKRLLMGSWGRKLDLFLDNAKNVYMTQSRRSKDATERKIQVSQFREIISKVKNYSPNGGAMSGLSGLFHGSKRSGDY